MRLALFINEDVRENVLRQTIHTEVVRDGDKSFGSKAIRPRMEVYTPLYHAIKGSLMPPQIISHSTIGFAQELIDELNNGGRN